MPTVVPFPYYQSLSGSSASDTMRATRIPCSARSFERIVSSFYLFCALALFSCISTVTAATSSNNATTITNTIYYAPVTITPSSNCLAKTSYSYISLHPLTGPSFSPLTSLLSDITPFTVATIPQATPPASITTGSNVAYVQVDVILSMAPFSVGYNGEEAAWAKACYDPRDTTCPAGDAYGPGDVGVSCITGFPGVVAAATDASSASASATVFGPYKNEGTARGRGGDKLLGLLLWQVAVVGGLMLV